MTDPKASQPIRILLIEDNPADVDLLRRAFAAAGLNYEVILLEDGAEALAFVRSVAADGEGVVPDLAVLDLNLPINDGLEVLQAIRSNPRFAAVPVAVLSSSASSRDRARIEQLGIGRYITKPPDLDEFLEIGNTLKKLLAAQPGQDS